MSAASAFGRPLTAPGPKWPGEIRLPGAGKELTRPAGTKEAGHAAVRPGLAGARVPGREGDALPDPLGPQLPGAGSHRGRGSGQALDLAMETARRLIRAATASAMSSRRTRLPALPHTRVTLLPGDQYQRRLRPARLPTGLFP